MEDRWREIEPASLTDNPFTLIGQDWMLITAGTRTHYNTMTAGWGGFGVLWNRNVCFCFVRPQRYTFRFMEEAPSFSLTFFAEKYRPVLDFCGSRSGREVDKAASCGLTPVEASPGIVSFAEARLVIGCRKIYWQDFDPARFIDPTIAEVYPARDYHRMYVGEITKCWIGRAGG